MNLRSLLLGWLIGIMVLPTLAQEVDVATVLADTKTFIFDNGENTVKGYVYAQLEAKTACCGDDRIYLEVKVDPSGYVLSAKPLTGSNACFKQSAVDIVKNIRWDAAEFKGPKSVYFEIRPSVECSDSRNNEYVALEVFNNEILAPGSTTSDGAPAEIATAEPDPADPEVLEELISATTSTEKEVAAEPEPEATKAAEPTPVEEVAAEKVEPTETEFEGIVTDEPAPRPADPPAQVAAEEVRPSGGVSRGEVEASEQVEAERVAQQQEIENLRSELERMRVEEEKRQKQLAAKEAARREREAAQQAAFEQQQEEYASAEESFGSTGGEEGLWLPGGEEGEAGEEGSFDTGMGGGDDEEARLREEIERLRQERIEVEETKRQREQEMMQAMEDTRRDNEQIFALEQEIAAREEEAARVREEMELRRLEEEKMQIDEARAREEEAYQQMMDEIARLQAEAEAKIRDLEAQKAEINRMTELEQKRQQEINLERAIREKERQKRMEEIRMQVMSSGTPITNITSNSNEDLEALIGNL
ncbi:MAG: hypothetical protein AAF804_12210, partial [Bacteroidota bacterium]